MIAATELRIENIVQEDNTLKIIEVETIHDEEINSDIKWGEQYGDPIQLKYISGILLTEEWLLKLGFEKDIFKDLVKGDFYWNESKDANLKYSRGEFSTLFFKNIKYVHQLQNLYFALTGEELTLQE